MNIDFPFHFDARGRTAATSDDDHVRDMIEQVLFTAPGERVNRPDFGSGLLQLRLRAATAPSSPTAAAVHRAGRAPALARRRDRAARRVDVDQRRRRRCGVDRRSTSSGAPASSAIDDVRGGAARDATPVLLCRDERAPRRSSAAADAQRHRLPRGRATTSRTLTVFFLAQGAAEVARAAQRAHRRRRGAITRHRGSIDVQMCRERRPDRDDCMVVALDRPGDFSTYTLCLVELDEDGGRGRADAGLRPALRRAPTSPSRPTARPTSTAAARARLPARACDEPEIDYLAKDYASFRQLILDRLALVDARLAASATCPTSASRSSSCSPTSATTSATTRTRSPPRRTSTRPGCAISVRRHARLVDYRDARGLQRARLGLRRDRQRRRARPADVGFVTGPPTRRRRRVLPCQELARLAAGRYEVFEPVAERDPSRSAPRTTRSASTPGATASAACRRRHVGHPGRPPASPPATARPPDARCEGDDAARRTKTADRPACRARPRIRSRRRGRCTCARATSLIFEEVLGPGTGDAGRRRPAHRHAVRLTRVDPADDPRHGANRSSRWRWADDDALPFPLCISASGRRRRAASSTDVSVARGNVVLVDHGRAGPRRGPRRRPGDRRDRALRRRRLRRAVAYCRRALPAPLDERR